MSRSARTRSDAARRGQALAARRRVGERFHVPGAMVLCKRRKALLFWRVSGAPCEARDLGVGGLSFENLGKRLAPGAEVRLLIHAPGKLPFQAQARIVRAEDQSGPGGQLCAALFTDFDTRAWNILCDLHSRHSQAAGAAEPERDPPSEKRRDPGMAMVVKAVPGPA